GEEVQGDAAGDRGPDEPPSEPAIHLVFEARSVGQQRALDPSAGREYLQHNLEDEPADKDADGGRSRQREMIEQRRRGQHQLAVVEGKAHPQVIDERHQGEQQDCRCRHIEGGGCRSRRCRRAAEPHRRLRLNTCQRKPLCMIRADSGRFLPCSYANLRLQSPRRNGYLNPRTPARSIACCIKPEAFACSTNSLTYESRPAWPLGTATPAKAAWKRSSKTREPGSRAEN